MAEITNLTILAKHPSIGAPYHYRKGKGPQDRTLYVYRVARVRNGTVMVCMMTESGQLDVATRLYELERDFKEGVAVQVAANKQASLGV